MEKIRIAIADDDAGMRMVVRKLIERADDYALVGEAENGEELLALFEKTRPEVVFMDVEMPGMSGVECARLIQDKNPKTIMVFVTAHEEYMADAFEVYAFDYLLKPFRLERAMHTLDLIRQRLRESAGAQDAPQKPVRFNAPARIMLRHREGVSFVDLNDILLVQREERATVVYVADGGRFVTGDTLGEMEERLPEGMFFRTHKSYIVNINHIESISPYGRWTYIVKLRGTKQDALITHERFEELQTRFA
ncbi:MAG TPA: response regulator transcription factor [Candidatus Ornithocaccomicrobium faecavium]|uniref:Stage 0 sporulation protein A homolog n=1 Tax=Candidatus Ornithocaccomicrobium faecavium TaxID=2840890 RepID=A0A9D1P6B5_9FIRM|nr:response regulator transcription factor [Candidatus Ornithocaccomicrobium faecavium]